MNHSTGSAVLKRRPKILIAPLDWGLGHATRCIPVIKELIAQQCEVWIAGEQAQSALLQQEFPSLTFLMLPGYRIKYSRSGAGLFWKILFQVSKILKAIHYENIWLKKMVNLHHFDAVIADNRYGLYHEKIPCIFITHQLAVKTFLRAWIERILQQWNYSFINRFTECWVPDKTGGSNLAGELSHPKKFPTIPVKFIGVLSRFEKTSEVLKKNELLILLSGPEPQRTIWEKKILNELKTYQGSATIVRGLPGENGTLSAPDNIRLLNHLAAEELNIIMQEAEWIIGRCGYSTVMDIVTLQKKSILIPTPGQTEQKYLANHLAKNHIAYCVQQDEFSISAVLLNAPAFPYKFIESNNDELKKIIAQFVSALNHD